LGAASTSISTLPSIRLRECDAHLREAERIVDRPTSRTVKAARKLISGFLAIAGAAPIGHDANERLSSVQVELKGLIEELRSLAERRKVEP
jgi:hypothetical protein